MRFEDAAMLCGACQNIFRRKLLLDRPLAHHQTKKSLLEAAEQSCHICTRLSTYFSKVGRIDLLSLQEDEDFTFTSYVIQTSEKSDFKVPKNALALGFNLEGIIVKPELSRFW
jgi:hypothetical protein